MKGQVAKSATQSTISWKNEESREKRLWTLWVLVQVHTYQLCDFEEIT